MSIEELIARLEVAAEGSSELDWWVYFTATDRGRNNFSQPEENLKLPWPQWIECHPMEMRLPHDYDEDLRPYTRSIDAALTLVPEGWFVAIKAFGKFGHADVFHPEKLAAGGLFPDAGEDDSTIRVRNAASPAIAVCIAALRARAGCGP
jgi:hypothetical protein